MMQKRDRDRAKLVRRPGDGMGTAKIEVIRVTDGQSLGVVKYTPESDASCQAMEEKLAAIAGKHNLDYIE